MKGIGKLMKQVQEMQANMQKMQEELAQLEVTGQAGGGMVTVVMNGRHEVKRVAIEPQVLEEDKEMLEDLVAAAFNDAAHKLEEAVREKFAGMGAGMPGGLKLPFS